MADNQTVSALPLPPMQYVNMYTDENIKRGRAPQPPMAIQENYMMFGTPFHSDDLIIRPLEMQGLRRLHPHNYDHKREMKKLNHSLLVNFLDLVDILIKAPDSQKRQEKMDDLNLIFIHMHHLINEFRPHQARETLRVILDRQKTQRLEITERFHKHLDKVQELLRGATESLPQDATTDSKLLTQVDILLASGEAPVEGDHVEYCDTLDKMMCDIIDTMNG